MYEADVSKQDETLQLYLWNTLYLAGSAYYRRIQLSQLALNATQRISTTKAASVNTFDYLLKHARRIFHVKLDITGLPCVSSNGCHSRHVMRLCFKNILFHSGYRYLLAPMYQLRNSTVRIFAPQLSGVRLVFHALKNLLLISFSKHVCRSLARDQFQRPRSRSVSLK